MFPAALQTILQRTAEWAGPRKPKGPDWALGQNQIDKDRPFYTRDSGGGKGEAVPAAYSAIGQIALALTGCPRIVINKRTKEAVEDHPLNLLMERPSKQMDRHQFWMWMHEAAVARGNSYAHIVRDRRTYDPVELVPAICWDTEWIGTQRRRRLFRLELLGDEGKQKEYTEQEVLSFHWRGFDGLESPSPLQYAARETLAHMQQIRHAQGIRVENANLASIILQFAPELLALHPDKRKEVTVTMRDNIETSRTHGGAVVVPPGLSVVQSTKLSGLDAELVAMLGWDVRDIARVWSISPLRLAEYPEGVRLGMFEYENAQFEGNTVRPWANMADAAMNHVGKLLMKRDRDLEWELDTNTDHLAQGLLSDRIEMAGKGFADYGIWTKNESRRHTAKPPIEGGDETMAPRGGSQPGKDNGQGNNNGGGNEND